MVPALVCLRLFFHGFLPKYFESSMRKEVSQLYPGSGEAVKVPTVDIIFLNRSRTIGIFLLYFGSKYQKPKIKRCVGFLLSHPAGR